MTASSYRPRKLLFLIVSYAIASRTQAALYALKEGLASLDDYEQKEF